MQKTKNIKGCIKLIECFELPKDIVIVMEKKGISLFSFLQNRKEYLEEKTIQYLFRQVAEIVVKCHEINVYHGDLKMENLLINPDTNEITLIDFGHGSYYTSEKNQRKRPGTTVIMPPEWFYYKSYDYEDATVWMLGILLYSLYFHKYPFKDEESIREPFIYFPPRSLSISAYSLMLQLLTRNPLHRVKLNNICVDPWLQTAIDS